MSTHEQLVIGSLHTIATRHWDALTGQARADALAELRTTAGDRTDLVIQAAGILLGLRRPDKQDDYWRKYTRGAELLLEVASVEASHPDVRHWVATGEERRKRHELRPEPKRAWLTRGPPAGAAVVTDDPTAPRSHDTLITVGVRVFHIQHHARQMPMDTAELDHLSDTAASPLHIEGEGLGPLLSIVTRRHHARNVAIPSQITD